MYEVKMISFILDQARLELPLLELLVLEEAGMGKQYSCFLGFFPKFSENIKVDLRSFIIIILDILSLRESSIALV